jgi:hypothetical protein
LFHTLGPAKLLNAQAAAARTLAANIAAAMAPHCAMHARVYVGIVQLSEDSVAAVRAAAIEAMLGTFRSIASCGDRDSQVLIVLWLLTRRYFALQKWHSTCRTHHEAVLRAATSSQCC